jgi:GntR family transcriptional regulator/MocR family aminotransferase
MHLIVWLRNLGFNRLTAFIEYARSFGLGLHPVHPHYHTRPRRPWLLIGYASLSVGELRSAIELLGRCLAREEAARQLLGALDSTQTGPD